MPEFKTKHEYAQWKAAKMEESQREAALNKIWVCPECLSSNENAVTKCNCGYVVNERIFPSLKGNIKSQELYKIILNEFDMFNDTSAIFLSHYFVKRFPNNEEALKLKQRMDGYSKRVVCGNCGTENIYNPEYYSKDKCQKCGELLHQYLGTDRPLQKCPTCGNEVSTKALSCPKCGEPFSGSQNRLWSPGVAALLSLFIPGAGQIYKGKLGAGIIWFFITVICWYGGWLAGSAVPIIAGLISYIACVIDAKNGDPTKEGG